MAAFAGVTELTLDGKAITEDYDNPRSQEEARDDLARSAEVHLQNLVRPFPGVHTLNVLNLDFDPSEDELGLGEPSESAVVTPPSDYYCQLQKLDFRACRISVKHVIQILEQSCGVRSLAIGGCLTGDGETLLRTLPGWLQN
ncbi:unnamed protein product [Mortierella alpina]